MIIYSDGVSVSTLLRSQRNQQLPVRTEYQRVVVRRRHLFDDALHRFKSGLDATKHLRVTFVGEPAVDEGGPLREFLFLLVGKIARNNSLFCGEETNRIPMHNMVELGKRTFYYIGVMLTISLIHGGPSPAFFAAAVADYIVYGMAKVKATPEDVADHAMREKLVKVIKILIAAAFVGLLGYIK